MWRRIHVCVLKREKKNFAIELIQGREVLSGRVATEMGKSSRAVLVLAIAASLCGPSAGFSVAPIGGARTRSHAALHRRPQMLRQASRAGARGLRASSEEDVDIEAFRDLLNDSWATQTASSEDGVRARPSSLFLRRRPAFRLYRATARTSLALDSCTF